MASTPCTQPINRECKENRRAFGTNKDLEWRDDDDEPSEVRTTEFRCLLRACPISRRPTLAGPSTSPGQSQSCPETAAAPATTTPITVSNPSSSGSSSGWSRPRNRTSSNQIITMSNNSASTGWSRLNKHRRPSQSSQRRTNSSRVAATTSSTHSSQATARNSQGTCSISKALMTRQKGTGGACCSRVGGSSPSNQGIEQYLCLPYTCGDLHNNAQKMSSSFPELLRRKTLLQRRSWCLIIFRGQQCSIFFFFSFSGHRQSRKLFVRSSARDLVQ